SHGGIMGGSGGHADTAAGARLAIVTSRLTAGGHAKIVDRVRTLTTPGATVDVVVTEVGLAVNPARVDLRDRFAEAGLPVLGMDELRKRAAALAAHPEIPRRDGRTVASVEYRDGTVIDTVPQVAA
ncbi:MAG: citrate lyase subunit alpha, partial [Parafilimonas terrae]|nr:citrate lyase subunit alpha [Parafilimonas terrae]